MEEAMECKGSVHRIRECAFDLLSLGDELIADDEDSWELMGRDLSLKSTFLYCDLRRVIASSCDGDRKKALTDLANRLLCHMEELSHAVKSRSVSLTQVHYSDAALVLQEVIGCPALIHPPLE